MKWSGIQNTLEESRSDVLILLDCCASGVCTTDEGNGVTELIAACAYNAVANGVGPFSFTHALNAKLRLLIQRPYFTIGYLYNALFTEVQGWRLEDSRHKKAPVHLVLSQNHDMPRSIRLSAPSKKKAEQSLKSALSSTSLHPDQTEVSTAQSISSLDESNGSNVGLSSPDTSLSSSMTSLSSMGSMPEYPRLLFSIRVDENVKPNDLSVEFFTDWLRGIPVSASLVRVEAGFASDSTLLMVSMPAAMLGYLPSDPAITLLGNIKSTNIMTRTCEAHPAHQHFSTVNEEKAPLINRLSKPTQSATWPREIIQLTPDPSSSSSDENSRPETTTAQRKVRAVTPKLPLPTLAEDEVVDVTHEPRTYNDSDGDSEDSFIDNYSIEDWSGSETHTNTTAPSMFPSRPASSHSQFPTRPEDDSTIIEESPWIVKEDSAKPSTVRSLSPFQIRGMSILDSKDGSEDLAPVISTTHPKLPPRIVSLADLPGPSKRNSSGSLILKAGLSHNPDLYSSSTAKGKEPHNNSLSYLLQKQASLEGNKFSYDTRFMGDPKNEVKRVLPSQSQVSSIHCPTCAHMGRKSEVLGGDTCNECGTNC